MVPFRPITRPAILHPMRALPNPKPLTLISFTNRKAQELGAKRQMTQSKHRATEATSDKAKIETLKADLASAHKALRARDHDLAQLSQSRVEMETRLSRVFEASDEFIYETDEKGCFTFLSDRFEEITGYAGAECINTRLADLVPPDERPAIRTAFLDIGRRLAEDRHFDLPISHKAGHIIWVNITIAPFFHDQGGVKGFCGSGSDITAQKQARADLQEREYLLNLATDMADLGYAIWNEDDDHFVKVSDSFAAIHGLSAEIYMRDYCGREASLSLLHPDDLDRYAAFEEALSWNEKDHSVEYRVCRPNGEIRYVHERYQFLHDDSRKANLSLVVIQDITDLKETQEKLHHISDTQVETASRLARIVDASGGFTYESAPNGQTTFLSDQFEILTGHTVKSMVGKNITELVVETARAAVSREIQDVALKPQSERYFEAPIVHKDGQIVWLRVTVAPYYAEDGTLIGYCGSGIDITPRKEWEIELEATREKADAANRAKTNFLATMSHEIRTPMNGVLGMAQLLNLTELTDHQRTYLNSIIESGDLLLSILNDVLDLSKIEERQLNLEEIPFEVGDILTKCTQLWAPRFEQKSLKMNVANRLNTPTHVCGDPTRLYQILQNLLGNALKFTEKGDVCLTAQLEDETEHTVSLHFEVADTGIGIDEAGQEVLFDRFAQVDSSTARKFGGSGLGLSICRELVTLMGGEIDVISAPGKGSLFWFTLALPKASRQTTQTKDDETGWSAPALPHLEQGTKILVAEDNVVNQNVITAFLKIAGLTAELASNGVEAVAAARAQQFDLILMDIQMPELDGLAATRQILDLSGHYKNIPIIALTANVAKADQVHYRDSGLTDFIAKPINPADLFDVLEKYVPEASSDNQSGALNKALDNSLKRRA